MMARQLPINEQYSSGVIVEMDGSSRLTSLA